jgi:hypothetical protein
MIFEDLLLPFNNMADWLVHRLVLEEAKDAQRE